MSVNAIKDEQFEVEVLKSDKPVLVDFWAEWCGPCQAFAPVLDELSKEMQEELKVTKVNIEESPESPTKYGVRSIPTLMIFKGGEMIGQHVGALSKTDCKNWIESVVK